MLDLDGVVYISGAAVPGVPEALGRLRDERVHVAFVTNNASRTARTVADHLTELGVPASEHDVVTSAQAAAGLLLDRHGAGARLLTMGADGLVGALKDVGLVPVLDPADPDVVGVVTGYGPDVVWKDLMKVAVRIRDGLPWVATNTDLTIPTAFGVAPGHGAQVEMLERFAEQTPLVAGKPARPLLDETVKRVGGEHPLMVGDRLDTDIEGGANAGVDTLLVLTGVSGLSEVVAAGVHERPSYIARTLEGLFTPHPVPEVLETSQLPEGGVAGARCGGWSAVVGQDGKLAVEGTGGADDWWRTVAVAGWTYADAAGHPPLVNRLVPPT
ncbi:HAD-IIA family hydrolase [Nocardioides daphniae]|nr:HAD-IIA family hydrolase [Nocardioides daphniae]